MASKKPPPVQLPGMSHAIPGDEKEWQKIIEERLEERGFWISHVGRGKTARGKWITPTEPGWPDIISGRPPWLLAIEVKGAKTVVRPTQIEWLERFAGFPYCRAWLLRVTMDWQLPANWIADPENAPQRYGWGIHRDVTSRSL